MKASKHTNPFEGPVGAADRTHIPEPHAPVCASISVQACQISSDHLPDAELQAVGDFCYTVDGETELLEGFKLPDSETVGFKLHDTPWTDEHLLLSRGYDLAALKARHQAAGFPPQFLNILHLAGSANVVFLLFAPWNANLPGLPLFYDN